MTEHIRYETEAGMARIVLDRPDKKNALSTAMWRAIPPMIERAAADEDVRVVILCSSTEAAFAAGADISEFEENYKTPQAAEATSGWIGNAVDAVETCAKPVLAAIEGICVGGGVSLAVAADLRLAGEGARFAVTPGKLGILYSPADTRRLVRVVGVAAAKDLLFTGRMIEAEEAFRLRLVDRFCARGDALAQALDLAETISGVSQWSVRATKEMIAGLGSGWEDDTEEAQSLFLSGFSGEDFGEGFRAFLEKRKPTFPYR
ncbi:MAG: enoyl-CoA hydratase-related protein [Parvularcula sp.]|jgi:enoyl-CoA hydratase/carnithine racemase|nr:enoyl-CoA hydratase-related protein [Parvularcula sp.]